MSELEKLAEQVPSMMRELIDKVHDEGSGRYHAREYIEASIRAAWLRAAEVAEQREAQIVNVLTNVCQLLDGWHADGTVWSEWDGAVRLQVSSLLKSAIDGKHAAQLRAMAKGEK